MCQKSVFLVLLAVEKQIFSSCLLLQSEHFSHFFHSRAVPSLCIRLWIHLPDVILTTWEICLLSSESLGFPVVQKDHVHPTPLACIYIQQMLKFVCVNGNHLVSSHARLLI